MDNVKQDEGKKKHLQKQTNLIKIINTLKENNNKTYLKLEQTFLQLLQLNHLSKPPRQSIPNKC